MSRTLVVDEWLFHDLIGEKGKGRRQEAGRFLQTLIARCDRLAIPPPSPWLDKAYRLMRRTDPRTREASRLLHLYILANPEKAQRLPKGDLPSLPDILAQRVAEADVYLVRCALAASADALITTDQRLAEALAASTLPIRVHRREDFLKEYLRPQPG